ncbi:neprilysin-11-like isoform X1 [Paramacrobiotus metropolitanus]|uniref:neprilysin-11-like isoform X1 n=1 Tax=Paramacrobiotus metropolitanus TaxID=2943436 RepID=UPI002445BA71|nr:neprilysin-11-like isoform X1 [Paramacrobiotus metropolitanus]
MDPSWYFLSLISLLRVFEWLLIVQIDPVRALESYAPSSQKACETPQCRKTASKFLDRINTSVDPCEDFYFYACGNWLNAHPIPDNETTVDEFYYLQKAIKETGQQLLNNETNQMFPSEAKLKDLYRQCKDEDQTARVGIKPLLDFLDTHIGGWPIITPNWNASRFDIFSALVWFYFTGSEPFFHMQVTKDLVDPLVNVIVVEPGDTYAGVDILTNNITGKLYTESYQQLLSNVTALLLRDTNLSQSEIDVASIKEIVDFQHYLGMEKLTTVESMNDSLFLNKVPLSDFGEKFCLNSSILRNIPMYIAAYFTETNVTNTISANNTLVVPNEKFWPKLNIRLAEWESGGDAGLKQIANYIGWSVISRALDYLPVDYRFALAEYNQKISGKTAPDNPPAGERCLTVVTGAMPLAIGAVYVRDTLPKQLKEKATNMVSDIQYGFRELLSSASWMDNATREAAIKKLGAMIDVAAYPDILISNIFLIDAEYADVVIHENYVQTMWQVSRNAKYRELQRYPRNNPRYDPVRDTLDVTWVNSYYEQANNVLNVNAAILQPPFYDTESPQYYNYGGIGTVIGHETTHGFDSLGSNYNDQGARKSWWSNATRAAFDERTHGMVAQYDNYNIAVGKVNGQLTLTENIADNGGIRAAYKGYLRHLDLSSRQETSIAGLEKYSFEQLFFLSAAQVWCQNIRPETARTKLLTDVHSPAQWRVNGMMSNMEEFAKAFSCSSGARMNPESKRIVW